MRALTNLVLTGVIAVGAHAATRYHPAQEFSSVNNPSGVWSYGYLLSTNSAFRLYPTNVNGSWALWAKDPFRAPPGWYTEGLFALSSNPQSIQFYRRSPIPYTYNELC